MECVLLTVGKIKDKALKLLIENYTKNLQKFTKLTIIEVKDEPEVKNASEEDLEILREKEAESLRKHIKTGYKIALAIEGKTFTSEALALEIEKIKTYHSSKLYFLIGGSYGISKSLKKEMDLLLSFSELTFPHQLMRVILLEQLFRSMKILNGEPYHT